VIVLLVARADAREIHENDRPVREQFVDITTVIDDVVLDMRYATKDNFTRKAVYPKSVCKLRSAVAKRLATAAALLRAQDRRLVVWDCYRPTSIQEVFWKLVPDERYVANPADGSRHSRGAAVDVSLADMEGRAVAMPTKFDDFSARAHRKHALAGKRGVEAKRLSDAMTEAGFVPMPTEWWHFDAPDAAKYALSNAPL